MSITRRGKVFYIRIRPFGPELITVRTPAETKTEATRIERAVLTACQSGDYRALDPVSRSVCLSMFRNRSLEIPEDLAGKETPKEELTLWRATEVFLNYPDVRNSPTRERYFSSLEHLVRKFGKAKPIKSLWVPDLRLYQADRLAEGVQPATVNKELGVLSRMFRVLVELQILDVNPCRLVRKLSEKTGERQIYISCGDFGRILEHLDLWFVPIAQVAYYSGMRQGEVVGLTRRQVNLKKRLIYLGPRDVKESHWKRVPVHRDLVPILEETLKVQALGVDHVFLRDGKPITRNDLRRAWDGKVQKVGLRPAPHFHDLRHVWMTNARRSGVDWEIRQAIVGHWAKTRAVTERYGRISDEELVRAIDQWSPDHGESEIWTARQPGSKRMCTKCAQTAPKNKKVACAGDVTF